MFDNLEQKKEQNPNGTPIKKSGGAPIFSNPTPSTIKKADPIPKKVEDMFAGVEDVKPPIPKPGSGIPNMPQSKQKTKSSGSIMKTLFFIIVLVVVMAIAIIIAGRIFGFPGISSIIFKTEQAIEVEDNNLPIDSAIVVPPVVTTPIVPEVIAVDTDGDGLTDEEELLIGTDINKEDTDEDGLSDKEEFLSYKTDPLKADTDGDGLTDYDEVILYKTDPKNIDTDGDTYSDGSEVKNGYNPNGEGEL